MAPLRAWRPPRCPLACCAALRGRVAPAFILRPCRTEATHFPAPSPVLAPVRPRPFAPTSHGARPSSQLGLPPPAPGGGFYIIPLRQNPNPHPLPRYAAPSRSRRGLGMYLGYLCRLQPIPRPFPRPRACPSSPLCSYVAWGETVQTARPAPSRSRRGH